jgi:hypothetical protein
VNDILPTEHWVVGLDLVDLRLYAVLLSPDYPVPFSGFAAGCQLQGTYSSSVNKIHGEKRRKEKNCSLLGYYTGSSYNLLPTFRENLYVPSSGFKASKRKPFAELRSQYREKCGISFGFLNPEDGTDILSRNVGNKLPLLTA